MSSPAVPVRESLANTKCKWAGASIASVPVFSDRKQEELAPRNRRARCFSDVLISFPPPLRQLYGARRALSPTVDPTLGLVGGAAFLATEEHAPISMVGLHERLPGQTYPLM
jgi:hypothetical protein